MTWLPVVTRLTIPSYSMTTPRGWPRNRQNIQRPPMHTCNTQLTISCSCCAVKTESEVGQEHGGHQAIGTRCERERMRCIFKATCTSDKLLVHSTVLKWALLSKPSADLLWADLDSLMNCKNRPWVSTDTVDKLATRRRGYFAYPVRAPLVPAIRP